MRTMRNARLAGLTRMTERDAQLNRSIKNGAFEGGDAGALRSRRKGVLAPMLHLAIMTATAALPAQALAQPQPIPRPRELRQAPVVAPQAPTPSNPSMMEPEQTAPPPSPPMSEVESPAQQQPSPKSRAQWRALHRACGEEWSRMLKAGKTTGLIWVDFFETCQKRP
jgi:hypothetical protein